MQAYLDMLTDTKTFSQIRHIIVSIVFKSSCKAARFNPGYIQNYLGKLLSVWGLAS